MIAVLFVPEMRLLCAPCLVCCGCLDFIACIGKLVFSIWGLIVVLFMVEQSECSECHDLHLCAWGCFVGLLLTQLAFFQMLNYRRNRDGVDPSLKKDGAGYGSVLPPNPSLRPISREELASEGRLYYMQR